MRARQFLAGAVIGAVALFGTAGIAAAQTTNPTAPAPQSKQTRCDKAKDRLAKLEVRRVRSEQIIDRLHKEIAVAKEHHRDDLVRKLQARLDTVQKRHDRIVDLINKIQAKIHDRCG